MLDGECLVFIEVRYRRDRIYGGALASVDAGKQKRILRTAAYFMQQHAEHRDRPVRFDVLALGPGTAEQDILWLQQAFVACEN
jgi:putative endonuclease